MTTSVIVTLVGFACAVLGIYLLSGAGWALLTGGTVLFVAGGLGSRERRGS